MSARDQIDDLLHAAAGAHFREMARVLGTIEGLTEGASDILAAHLPRLREARDRLSGIIERCEDKQP